MISVLYVDDEAFLLDIGRTYLERTGQFTVGTAQSAQEALELIRNQPFDAIVSDYQMPGMDGIEFLKKLRASGDSTPFIIFTGKGREEVVIRAFESGADFYLQKGGEPRAQFTELAQKILRAVEFRTAEKARAETEQRLTGIIAFLPDATFAIDKEGRVIAWNRAIEEMTGIPAKDMVGKGDHEYALPFYGERRPLLIDQALHPDNEIEKQYDTISREGDRLVVESSDARPRGKPAILWATATPLYDKSGRVSGAIQSVRDITDRRQAEDTLREREEQLALVIEGSGVGTYDWWVKTGETVFNERWAEMIGYTLAELSPVSIDTWNRFCHPDDLIRSDEALERHFSGETPVYECEVRMHHRDGRWIWVLDRGKVVQRDMDDRPVRMAGTHLDITERKNTENILNQTVDELRRFNALTVDRELRMIALKAEVNTCLKEAGKPEKYRIAE